MLLFANYSTLGPSCIYNPTDDCDDESVFDATSSSVGSLRRRLFLGEDDASQAGDAEDDMVGFLYRINNRLLQLTLFCFFHTFKFLRSTQTVDALTSATQFFCVLQTEIQLRLSFRFHNSS